MPRDVPPPRAIDRRASDRSASASLGATTALLGLVLLTLLPPTGALHLRPMYFTQCYGTQEGWVTGTQYGYSNTSGWSNNYSTGGLALASQSSQAFQNPSNAAYSTGGWISMGPGPSNGLCFSPSNTSGQLVYTFTHTSFTLALNATCSSAGGTSAQSSATIEFQGNIYDLSSATFVWSQSPTTVVHQRTIACTSAASLSVHHTFALTPAVRVAASTSNLHTGDRYWFIVDIDVTTTASASGSGTTASATVTNLTSTLAGIRCAVC